MSDAPETVIERTPWIISRKQDLIWFQGSVLAGLFLLLLFLALPELNSSNYTVVHPAVLLLLVWGVSLDGTHVFSTYARTYFANDADSRARIPGSWGWALIAVGPAVALVDYKFFEPGPSIVGQAGTLFRHFLVIAYIWAYYHLIRQHYGFFSLYKRKSSKKSANWDVWFLWVGALYPFLKFSLSEAYLSSGLPNPIPQGYFANLNSIIDLLFLSFIFIYLICFAFLASKKSLNIEPKHVFVVIVVAFHMLVFKCLHNLLAITATLTIFHNIQYHRIVWQYERGKGRIPMGSVASYLAFGLALGMLWYTPRVLGVAVAETDLTRNLLLGFGWGIAFHHYFMDARIWRVRRQPQVGKTLDRGAV